MAAKRKSWLGEFWRPLAALLLWVLGMVPLIAAPPLLSLAETRIGGLTAFPVDCIPAAQLFSSDLTRACGPPLYDVASGCSVAANRGADFVSGSGRLGGDLYGADGLRKLGNYLGNRGVKLELAGDEALGATGRGAFDATNMRLFLRPDATKYEAWHEMGHFLHMRSIGRDAYLALPRGAARNVPEQTVFDLLERPGRWSRLTDAERAHAAQYIEQVGGFR